MGYARGLSLPEEHMCAGPPADCARGRRQGCVPPMLATCPAASGRAGPILHYGGLTTIAWPSDQRVNVVSPTMTTASGS
jgi:hypothetical protein